MLTFRLQSPLLIAPEEAKLKTVNFWSTDSEELFVKNTTSQPDNWHWHNTPVTYSWNQLGYRTKEISDVYDDFLLTFGCSYTEGIDRKSVV